MVPSTEVSLAHRARMALATALLAFAAPAPAWSQLTLGQASCSSPTATVNGYLGINYTCTLASGVVLNPVTPITVAAPNYVGLSYTNNGLIEASFPLTGTGVLGQPAPLVSFTNAGRMDPSGSYALLAQSVGVMGTGGNYQGSDAGAVTVINGGLIGPPDVIPPPAQSLGGLTLPQAAGLWAQSVGGAGYADDHGQGHGGAGSTVTVTLNPGSSVPLDNNVAGVYALSAGGQGAGFSHDSTHNYSSGGDAGNVVVTVGGSIGNNYPPGVPQIAAGSVGVYALSVGGSSGATDSKYSLRGGNAGTVSVTLTGSGTIGMTGDGSVGIFAASAGGLSWYADNGTSNGHQNGNGNAVNVTLNPGSSITTNGELGVGIAAISTGGNANTSQRPPDSLENGGSPNAVPTDLAPPGNAGNVTVTNGGSIATQGNVAIGIAAVSSTGGRGIGLMQNGQIDQVGNVGPGTGTPGTVTVTNSGSISTSGVGGIGILALSLGGSGGVLDSKPGLLNLLGSHTAGTGANGNQVTVNNTGAVTTQGPVSMGILAESIGGGGGTATGTGGVIAIGTNGGVGGNGGPVNVAASGGTITTQGDGSFGILAHSVGGGGGNGGNATGLVASVGGAAGAAGSGGNINIAYGSFAPGWSLSTQGDYAPGIGAQSIGGGGGNGGYAKTYSLDPVSAAIGGSGGAGGSGGVVILDGYGGRIATNGAQSPGLLAQSVGGGGGAGGAASVYSAGLSFAVTTALGGKGAGGGSGDQVSVVNASNIGTGGLDSIGIVAQSIGGGGGNGGSALARSTAIPTELPSISISTSIGGNGGAGGNGGVVGIVNNATIATQGDRSIGVLAQSIGGGGGNGGDSSAMAAAMESESGTLKIGVAIGGDGKIAGSGGSVQVINGGASPVCDVLCRGKISTAGNNAAGIVAQSIGGGGGNGGAGNASTGEGDSEAAASIGVTYSMGGQGGAGGSGGIIGVTNQAGSTIQTTGSGSQGVLAQSIGGGGGNGGGGAASGKGDTYVVTISVGGAAASGSTGGEVGVLNSGTIATGRVNQTSLGSYTSGGDAVGILAQSIGGGGGVGGSSDAAANVSGKSQIADTLDGPSSGYSASVAVGGAGGTGGNAGIVQVTNSGSITTLGERAYGVLAQSIGGGGGSAGAVNSAAGLNRSVRDSSYAATVSVGGNGGAGGDGGAVTVGSTGSVFTAGYGATALVAQSIGGGGGVGAEGTVNNTTTVGLGVGWNGSGSGGGTGGTVNVTSGALTTLGDDAHGILAQSIGGGGGLGSVGCSNSAGASLQGVRASICFGNIAGATGSFTPWNDTSSFTLNIGGGAGASGDGGTVSVDATGAIVTTGARSLGIVAQSIGGGGGIVTASAANIVKATVQAAAGQNGGTANNVSVSLAAGGSITTSGAGAWGILAQSLGGGGGFAGDPSLPLAVPVSNSQQTKAGVNLDAGQVHVNVAGNITTTGANAHGIVAQSIGGGGGIVNNGTNTALLMGNSAQIYSTSSGSHPGQGNGVYITQSAGTISTSGVGSIGILAQSSGTPTSANGNYTQPIYVTIGGTVIGGTNAGYSSGGVGAAGVALSGGGFYNSFSNNPTSYGNYIQVNAGGSISTVDGTAGNAIQANDGLTNVLNNGTITGNINLGSTPGIIANNGVMNTGASVVAASFNNAGTINVGGAGAIGRTQITGNFQQAATGILAIDVNSSAAQTADVVVVTGNAQVGGLVMPLASNLLPGSMTVLTAGALGVTAAAQPSLVFNWNLAASGNALTLSPQSNFLPQSVALTSSEASLARYLTGAWNGADRLFASTFGYLSQINSGSAYTSALNAFSAKVTQAQATALAGAEGTMLGAAMSCPVFVDQGTLLGEDNCVWARFTGSQTNQYTTTDVQGYNVAGTVYRLGGQHEVAPGWYFGGSIAGGQDWATMSGGSSGHGQSFDGTLALKHTAGPWLFAGSVAIASGAFHNNRLVSLPGIGTLAPVNTLLQSDSNILLVGGRLRGGYEFAFDNWYVRPYGDLDMVYTHVPGFQEFGQTGYALNVQSSSKTNVIIAPMVEVGGRYNVDATTILRPYAAAGVSLRPGNTRTITSSFVGAQPGDGSFQSLIQSPNVLGNFALGVQLYRVGGFEVKAEYGLQVGGSFLAQAGSARVAYHF